MEDSISVELEGCFVFLVVHTGRPDGAVTVLQRPSIKSQTADLPHCFETGDLIAVDLLLKKGNYQFLRLADRSGWLCPSKNQARITGWSHSYPLPDQLSIIQLLTEQGLWSFYVDNIPIGHVMRDHPTETLPGALEISPTFGTHTTDGGADPSGGSNDLLLPMQKIYCDFKIMHPVTGIMFFRIQGINKWVLDRIPAKNPADDDIVMLLPEDQVQTGVFCYRALASMAVRDRADISDKSMTPSAIAQGELVVADRIRHSPYQRGNGPFLRLADGSGWLFECKQHHKVMEAIPVITGQWEFRVLNFPKGIGVFRQPIDCNASLIPGVVFQAGALVQCDRRIYDERTNANYYRVAGMENGWILDKRKHVDLLELLSSSEKVNVNDTIHGWTKDYVRGVAATVEGLEEWEPPVEGQALAFGRLDSPLRLHVYYGTRTVTIMSQGAFEGHTITTQRCYRDCSSNDLIDLFRYERLQDNDDDEEEEKKEEFANAISNRNWMRTHKEEDLRQEIVILDNEIANLKTKRSQLLQKVHNLDLERSKHSTNLADAAVRRQQEFEVRQKERLLAEYAEQKAEQNSIQENITDGSAGKLSRGQYECGECHRIFPGKYSRDIHCREAHGLFCEQCERIFHSFPALAHHQRNDHKW